MGHPCKFQRVSRLGSVTARHCSSGRQPNFAALNTGRHLYSAGRPSRWALAHISSVFTYLLCVTHLISVFVTSSAKDCYIIDAPKSQTHFLGFVRLIGLFRNRPCVPVPEMTYNVFSGTLNPTHLLTYTYPCVRLFVCSQQLYRQL